MTTTLQSPYRESGAVAPDDGAKYAPCVVFDEPLSSHDMHGARVRVVRAFKQVDQSIVCTHVVEIAHGRDSMGALSWTTFEPDASKPWLWEQVLQVIARGLDSAYARTA